MKNQATIPERGEMGHGKSKGNAAGRIFEVVLYRGAMPEICGVRALQAGFVCPKCGCQHIYHLSNGLYQCPLLLPNFSHVWDGALPKPCTADHLVFGILPGMHCQAEHFCCTTGRLSHLQDQMIYVRENPHRYGAAGCGT